MKQSLLPILIILCLLTKGQDTEHHVFFSQSGASTVFTHNLYSRHRFCVFDTLNREVMVASYSDSTFRHIDSLVIVDSMAAISVLMKNIMELADQSNHWCHKYYDSCAILWKPYFKKHKVKKQDKVFYPMTEIVKMSNEDIIRLEYRRNGDRYNFVRDSTKDGYDLIPIETAIIQHKTPDTDFRAVLIAKAEQSWADMAWKISPGDTIESYGALDVRFKNGDHWMTFQTQENLPWYSGDHWWKWLGFWIGVVSIICAIILLAVLWGIWDDPFGHQEEIMRQENLHK